MSVLAWPAIGGWSGARAREVLLGPTRPAFREVRSEVVAENGHRTLVVAGEIVNRSDRAIGLAPLEFLVRNGDEQVLATWTSPPPRPSLRPGEAARFEGRLIAPPAEGREVRVHFTREAAERSPL